MVDIASAAGAPVSSPTQTYAGIRANEARFEAEAAVAAAPGSTGLDAASKALTDTSVQLGATALLYPDRAAQLYAVGDQLAQRQSALATAYGQRNSTSPGLPAPDAAYSAALATLDKPPNPSSSLGVARVAGGGVLAGLVLLGVSLWIAPRSKRVVNAGLVGALVLTAGATAVGVDVLSRSGPSARVDDIVRVRAEGAAVVAAEASALQRGSAVSDVVGRRAPHLDTAQQIVDRDGSSGAQISTAWQEFTRAKLTDQQLGGGVTQTTATLVSRRLKDLDALNATLSQQARAAGEGADSRPPLVAGYGVFVLSLMAGAAAWTGVGRRLSEYR